MISPNDKKVKAEPQKSDRGTSNVGANEKNQSTIEQITSSATVPATAADDTKEEAEDEPGRVIFPVKLHRILTCRKHDDVICWMSHGRCWRVLKPTVFEKDVMPLYFKQTKYSSFTRQVNGWNYRRIHSGKDKGCYYHEYFQRDAPDLCYNMKRSTRRKTADPFYNNEAPSGTSRGLRNMPNIINPMNMNINNAHHHQYAPPIVGQMGISMPNNVGSGMMTGAGDVGVGLLGNPALLQQSFANTALFQQQHLQQQLNMGQQLPSSMLAPHSLLEAHHQHQYQQGPASGGIANTAPMNDPYINMAQQRQGLSLLSQQNPMLPTGLSQFGSQQGSQGPDGSFPQGPNVYLGGIAANATTGQGGLPPLQGHAAVDPAQNPVQLAQQPTNDADIYSYQHQQQQQQRQSINSQSSGMFNYQMPPPA